MPGTQIERQVPEQILLSVGEPFRQKVPVLKGTVAEVTMIDNRPHYVGVYVDPLTGDSDTRMFTNDDIEFDPEGVAAS